MRAIFIFLTFTSFFLTGCSSVKIVKEVTKATQKIENSVQKIFKSSKEKKNDNKISKKQKVSDEEENIIIDISQDEKDNKLEISKEQIQVNEIVTTQKKIFSMNLLNKSIKEVSQLIGSPDFIRKDGKTLTARFDSRSCRLFIYMNSTLNIPRVEHYELRNSVGELIEQAKDIEFCFKEINPV